jgi:hypothetical protein
MAANLKNLSEAIDQAAPDRRLAAAIRLKRDRIQSDISRDGVSFITVDGHEFRVLAADGRARDTKPKA